MVNDKTPVEIKSDAPSARDTYGADELYDQCFAGEKPRPAAKPDPKTIFTRVLRQIETMELKTLAAVDRETTMPRGYVFAIHELDTDFVTIGHGGRSHLRSTLKRLQVGNPHKLEIAAVLQRYSFDDARDLCELICSGLTSYQARSKIWFTMDDCRRKIVAMFAKIDKYDNPLVCQPRQSQSQSQLQSRQSQSQDESLSQAPKLIRQHSFMVQ